MVRTVLYGVERRRTTCARSGRLCIEISCRWALIQMMAERFIAIADDPSYVGESGGQPRGIA